MGNNFFIKKDTCKYCGHCSEKLHIGKSSFGHKFMFSTDIGTTYEDILKVIINETIVDEYGTEIKFNDFKMKVALKQNGSDEYNFCDEWFC